MTWALPSFIIVSFLGIQDACHRLLQTVLLTISPTVFLQRISDLWLRTDGLENYVSVRTLCSFMISCDETVFFKRSQRFIIFETHRFKRYWKPCNLHWVSTSQKGSTSISVEFIWMVTLIKILMTHRLKLQSSGT